MNNINYDIESNNSNDKIVNTSYKENNIETVNNNKASNEEYNNFDFENFSINYDISGLKRMVNNAINEKNKVINEKDQLSARLNILKYEENKVITIFIC